jgi:hypothetical protein
MSELIDDLEWPRAGSDESPPTPVHHAMQTLRAALMFHRGGWCAKQIERVRKSSKRRPADLRGLPVQVSRRPVCPHFGCVRNDAGIAGSRVDWNQRVS